MFKISILDMCLEIANFKITAACLRANKLNIFRRTMVPRDNT